MTTEELHQRLQAAEANLNSMIQREEAARERRLRQEGAVLTLQLLLQEAQQAEAPAETQPAETEVGDA